MVDQPADPAPWLTVDIDTDNAVRYRDKVVFDPAEDDPIVLVSALQSLREQALQQGVIRLHTLAVPGEPDSLDDPVAPFLPVADDAEAPRVREPVRVEAHRWSLWVAMANLMRRMSQPGIAFDVLQLASLDVPD